MASRLRSALWLISDCRYAAPAQPRPPTCPHEREDILATQFPSDVLGFWHLAARGGLLGRGVFGNLSKEPSALKLSSTPSSSYTPNSHLLTQCHVLTILPHLVLSTQGTRSHTRNATTDRVLSSCQAYKRQHSGPRPRAHPRCRSPTYAPVQLATARRGP
ncbi:hypothetical protein FKP32DRAFT_1232451 [Trametes sanguinea]|nr:hypothetical protein FKP32DRAFT_1232451 [Trametes sanguinea]